VSWLLDTCVISELVRPKPKASVVYWVHERDEEELFLSVVTIGERVKGIAKLPASTKRGKLEQWGRRELADRFGERLLVIDSGAAARWGAMAAASEARGQAPPAIDGPIAATSLQHDLTVVTRDAEDVERCGPRCVNPWVEG
jgi:toxin FitB